MSNSEHLLAVGSEVLRWDLSRELALEFAESQVFTAIFYLITITVTLSPEESRAGWG